MQNTVEGSIMVVYHEKRKRKKEVLIITKEVMKYVNCKNIAPIDSLDFPIFPK